MWQQLRSPDADEYDMILPYWWHVQQALHEGIMEDKIHEDMLEYKNYERVWFGVL